MNKRPSWMRRAFAALPSHAQDRIFLVASQYATPVWAHRLGLNSMEGALGIAKGNGFHPTAVVDIGANIGEWANIARRIFPATPLFMIDGNPQNSEALRSAATRLGDKCKHFISLLGSQPSDSVTFFQNGKGSSVLPELTSYKTTAVTVPMETLDSLLEAQRLRGPLLLKLDVQGYELEVLRGAPRTLAECELVIMEVSLIPYNAGAPLFSDVVSFMAAAGYLVFDICGQSRRQTDDVLAQSDVLFARKDSSLRRQKKFWLNEP